MSKAITIVAAGAPAALLQAASAMVAKATGGAVKASQAATAVSHAVVVGDATPAGVYAAVTQAPSQPFAAYAGLKTTVVRAILPRDPAAAMQLRDVVDIYPGAGIACDAETAQATASFAKAAQVAVEKAKEIQTKRVTLVVKQASKYARLNDLFLSAATKAIEGAGMSVEVTHTAQAANSLVMFPEKYGVVLTNDDPVAENIQHAFAGITGGAPTTYYTVSGGKISGGASYKSVALALAQELKALGMSAEAAKIEGAAVKDPRNIANAL